MTSKKKGKVKSTKIGRPFYGTVDNHEGKEDHVPKKRSIFREFKKFIKKGKLWRQ
jgi:hypothetical protein